jgi:septal ring factor EnvC (AmiA/AmiB activator)
VIKCRYYPDGCSYTSKLGEIGKHEAGCHFKNSTMGASNRDPFSAGNKNGAQAKALKPVADYKDLPDTASPFTDKTYFITCRKGCNKQILTKKEYESHRCVDHLRNVIRDQNREKEMLNEHLDEAEKDVKDLLNEFERCKDSQETVIDDLKEKLMFLEKRNENLKEERSRRTKDYEERLNLEKVKSEKESTLAFMNFIQTAEKDFTLFCSRLNKDFSKYKDKLKDEASTYQLKTKANLMAKETDGIKVSSSP